MYFKQILAIVLIFQIIASMDCRSTKRRINKRSNSRRSFYIKIDQRFGVNYVQETSQTCEQVRRSGVYCPYHEKFEGTFLTSAAGNVTEGIAVRSISPWIYLMDYDETRRPATLVTACCVCTNCVIRTLGGYERDVNKYSYHVYMQQFVEKITSIGNVTVPHQVGAGCTCAGTE